MFLFVVHKFQIVLFEILAFQRSQCFCLGDRKVKGFNSRKSDVQPGLMHGNFRSHYDFKSQNSYQNNVLEWNMMEINGYRSHIAQIFRAIVLSFNPTTTAHLSSMV
jgi:hypothetical protein